jgi:hypothetical protein
MEIWCCRPSFSSASAWPALTSRQADAPEHAENVPVVQLDLGAVATQQLVCQRQADVETHPPTSHLGDVDAGVEDPAPLFGRQLQGAVADDDRRSPVLRVRLDPEGALAGRSPAAGGARKGQDVEKGCSEVSPGNQGRRGRPEVGRDITDATS